MTEQAEADRAYEREVRRLREFATAVTLVVGWAALRALGVIGRPR